MGELQLDSLPPDEGVSAGGSNCSTNCSSPSYLETYMIKQLTVLSRENTNFTWREVKRTIKETPLEKDANSNSPIMRPNNKTGRAAMGPDHVHKDLTNKGTGPSADYNKGYNGGGSNTVNPRKHENRNPKSDLYKDPMPSGATDPANYKKGISPDGNTQPGVMYNNNKRRGDIQNHWEGKTTGPMPLPEGKNLYQGPKKDSKKKFDQKFVGVRKRSPHFTPAALINTPQMTVKTKDNFEGRKDFHAESPEQNHLKLRRKSSLWRQKPIKQLQVIKYYNGTKLNDQEHD